MARDTRAHLMPAPSPASLLAVATAAALVLVASCNSGGAADPGGAQPTGGSGAATNPDRGQGGQSNGQAGTASAPSGGAGGNSAGTGGAGQAMGGGAPGGAGGAGTDSDAAPTPSPPGASAGEITVAAGDVARNATIVSFPFPGGAGTARVLALRAAGGERLPLQVDATGTATFILPELAAGAQATFTIETPAMTAMTAPAVTAAREADGVAVAVGGAAVFRYRTMGKLPPGIGDAYLRGGYLHPITTPGGLLVSDDYPGDHRHHHGLWSAWAHTVFEGHDVDFWNMGGRSAKVDFDALNATWEGPVHGGLEARQVHVSLAGGSKVALNETWHITAYRTHATAAPYFVFDLDSKQEAASASPVMLQKYIYGGFALRGHASWNGAGGAVFLTSEGKTRANGDGTDMRWCFMGGKVDGKMAGYAALGHPDNFRAPQPVRINPTNPFFSIAPVRDSGFDIAEGKPYISRYRIVVTDGGPDKDLLDRLWNDYAHPPMVTVHAP
jgi:hypothetical protein